MITLIEIELKGGSDVNSNNEIHKLYVEKRIENILDEDAATADAHVQVDQIRTREYFKMHI
ncbi:hypothetical protein BLOT_006119 [Blomia tropicalis]|nr:hypothetical protein BLOT_006119 [Blomia tropicalis]